MNFGKTLKRNYKIFYKIIITSLSSIIGICLFLFIHKFILESEVMNVITDTLPVKSQSQAIPKVFHTIWLDFGKGEDVFPKYIENSRKLLELHPGWKLKLWKEKEIENLIKEKFPSALETFLNYDLPIKKHDFSRIVILYCFGGVYVDHDGIALKNIESLLESLKFVIINESVNEFFPSNAFIASISKFDILKKYIDEMCKPDAAKKSVISATGPKMLKKVMLKNFKNYTQDEIRIYPSKFMFELKSSRNRSVKNQNPETLRLLYPDCYILHLFDYTWKNKK